MREWCEQTGAQADAALTHLLERGGFPEPCLAESLEQAERWRRQYFDGLVRDDVLEFSRIQEVNTIKLFAQMLRSRVGSPLSLASMARDLAVSPVTLKNTWTFWKPCSLCSWSAPGTTTSPAQCCRRPRCIFTTPAWSKATRAPVSRT